uniref:Uncharacterized protein n=1 Tax=Brassica campestris TaxID=3711 RepID=M4F0D0_BRACM
MLPLRIGEADDAFFICSTASAKSRSVAAAADYSATPIQLQAIVHYATFTITPQQNIHEISISFNVLKELAPANFLVFGMGRVEKFRRRRRGNKREKKRKKKKKVLCLFLLTRGGKTHFKTGPRKP